MFNYNVPVIALSLIKKKNILSFLLNNLLQPSFFLYFLSFPSFHLFILLTKQKGRNCNFIYIKKSL